MNETEDRRPAASLNGRRAAVTGASGFIGGRLVERLLEQGVAVTCLLRGKPKGSLQASGASFATLDIANEDALRKALQGTDWVFHLAYDWNNED